MSSPDEFESILKEVVLAKRLSASRMTKLTEIALKSMEYDTSLVSALYRTHKSLTPVAKISSLYVFDALSRAARHQVTKQGITGDINSPHGNSATFLLKIEGILEGLFQDMVSLDSTEAKEKTQKILDIWVKGNTFPSRILSRLTDILKETGKASELKSLTTSDPRMAVAQPVVTTPPASATTTSPATPVVDPQATLLALLAQAANAAAIPTQTIPNKEGGFDAAQAQLSVLQQLALAQTASSAALSQAAPSPQALLSHSGPSFATPSSYGEETYNSYHKERRFNNEPQSSDRVNNHPEDRPSFRGGYRGFRGRGRGRWDDRDRYRERENFGNDRSPSYKGPRSRSRSPSNRHGGRRDVRPYSPPRRPNIESMGSQGRDSADSTADVTGKDEFGRDLRPLSPESEPTPPKRSSPQPLSPVISTTTPPAAIQKSAANPLPESPSSHDQMSLSSSVAANTPSSTPSTINTSTISAQSGLENFNPATFDFTSPASWEALGKMWQVTNGYLPTTQQLAEYVMSGGQANHAASSTQEHGWQDTTSHGWRGRGRGGFSRGRGSFVPGGRRNPHESWVQRDSNHETDAIVLGGGSEADMEIDGKDSGESAGGGGGKMQKVGDKWVFVQGSVTT